jgi:hypothetical protein
MLAATTTAVAAAAAPDAAAPDAAAAATAPAVPAAANPAMAARASAAAAAAIDGLRRGDGLGAPQRVLRIGENNQRVVARVTEQAVRQRG